MCTSGAVPWPGGSAGDRGTHPSPKIQLLVPKLCPSMEPGLACSQIYPLHSMGCSSAPASIPAPPKQHGTDRPIK